MATVNKSINGTLSVIDFQMTNGAASGCVLTSDVNGNASWATGGGGGGLSTANNGLCVYGTNVALGGALTGNTTISMSGADYLRIQGGTSNCFQVTTGATTMFATAFPYFSSICVAPNRLQLMTIDLAAGGHLQYMETDPANDLVQLVSGNGGGTNAFFNVKYTDIKVCGNIAGFAGIEYCADYSTGYSTRSLVDCAYVASQVSDCRLKCNLTALSGTIADICAYSYKFNEELTNCDNCCGYGLLAQEVKEHYPFAVKDNSREIDGVCYMGIDYVQLIPVLWNIIKEQDARIKVLEDKLNS